MKSLGSAILSNVATMATGLLGSWLKKITVDRSMSGAEREAFRLNAEEAQKARDWNLEMDSTKYQRQVVDMQKAGVNPALAMNGGVTTQATSNVAAHASTSPTPIMSVADLATTAAALKSAKADQDLKKAQADNYKEDERGKRIRNNVDDITLLDQRLEELREIRSRADVNEETKKEIAKKIEVLEEERKIKIQEQTLNNDQHEIYELTKQEMRIRIENLPEQIRSAIAVNWAQAGYTKAQTDVKIAELESWDWNNAKTVTYSYARSIGAKIHFNLFKNVVNPGRFAGANSGEQGVGAGATVGLNEHTEGLLIYDRKTKELQFIPTYGYFKDSKEEYKEDKKEEKKEDRAEKKAERKANREPAKRDVVGGLKDGSFTLGGAK